MGHRKLVAFFLAREPNVRKFDESCTTCAFLLSFFSDAELSSCALTPLFRPRIIPQWLSGQGGQRISVPLRFASELVSLIGSHNMPGQQPTLTLLTLDTTGVLGSVYNFSHS